MALWIASYADGNFRGPEHEYRYLPSPDWFVRRISRHAGVGIVDAVFASKIPRQERRHAFSGSIYIRGLLRLSAGPRSEHQRGWMASWSDECSLLKSYFGLSSQGFYSLQVIDRATLRRPGELTIISAKEQRSKRFANS